jgi:glycosyltransferase involved in cell wall biosynthesis
MLMSRAGLSIVIPVYRNADTLDALLDRLDGLSRELPVDLEVVFVVDGSPDDCHERLAAALPTRAFRSRLACLSRNFGSFAAIRFGLSQACGPFFMVMAADLQEPPELAKDALRLLSEGQIDVVLFQRVSRADPWLTRVTSRIYWSVYRSFVQRQMPSGGIDVFACNRAARDALLSMRECSTSLVGQVVWLGFRQAVLPYDRQARPGGRSAWTLSKKIRYMLDSVFSFTDLPILALTLVGLVGCGVTTGVALVVLVYWWLGAIPVPGYTAIILAILFSTFLIVLALGIIGQYIWRTFENVKSRPLHIPMSVQEFNPRQGEK